MLSTPPPINASLPPLTIWYAASAIDCRPDEQNRLTVTPPVELGSPASMAETLAMLVLGGATPCCQDRNADYTKGECETIKFHTPFLQECFEPISSFISTTLFISTTFSVPSHSLTTRQIGSAVIRSHSNFSALNSPELYCL